MIRRLLIAVCVIVCVVIFAWLNPYEIEPPIESRFIKIGNDGKAQATWSGPWQCVCDSQTGLLWEAKTDNEGIHDGYWSYSWYDGHKGVENSGDCYFEEDRCDTSDLIRRTNVEKTCNASNWRLPTTNELKTLVDLDAKPGEPTIDKDFFPHTKHGDYWTADSDKPLTGVFKYLHKGAAAISFVDGNVFHIPYRNAAFVRLVTRHSSLCHQETPQ